MRLSTSYHYALSRQQNDDAASIDVYDDDGPRLGDSQAPMPIGPKPMPQTHVPGSYIRNLMGHFLCKVNNVSSPNLTFPKATSSASAFSAISMSADSSPSLVSLSPAISTASSPPQAIPYRKGRLHHKGINVSRDMVYTPSPTPGRHVIDIHPSPLGKSVVRHDNIWVQDWVLISLIILLTILLGLLIIFVYQVAVTM